jgi:capsular exopolysaccharide synthesis family protein
MSRVFEALLRSEAERFGLENISLDSNSALDLLQSREHGSRPETSAANEFSPTPGSEIDLSPSRQAEEERQGDDVTTQEFSNAPVLWPNPQANARMVCFTDRGSLEAENFRLLSVRMYHRRDKLKLRRIVITSSIPQEGKSVVAANLALSLARNLRTVLIDGDLRRPTQTRGFGFQRDLPGLSECLRGERKLADCVYKLEPVGLWFLPAGLAPANTPELMQSGQLSDILDTLQTFFDWIIIDTPPILPMADTSLWAKLANGVLMVARLGVSESKMLLKAIDVLHSSHILGLILNNHSGRSQAYYAQYSMKTIHSGHTSPPRES